MRREVSVASDAVAARHALTVFGVIWFALQFFKLLIAAELAPFGDEAFYWQESRALAWSYADVPPATAWLIRLGEMICGHSPLGMRSLFLVLGAALPLLLWRLVRREAGVVAACWAASGWLLLPLGGSLGVMALPDVPLTFAALLLLDGLLRLLRQERAGALLFGAGLLLAWLAHYRAALLLPGGLGLLLLSRHGRPLLRRRDFWLALAGGLLGLVPLLLFNRANGWVGLSFQAVERHPWRFHADGLLQPLEQTLTVTPLLYGLLLWALWRCVRQASDSARAAVLAWSGGSVVVIYFLFGLFGDDLRFRLHWPLPAYLAGLVALGVMVKAGEVSRRWLRTAYALAGLGSVLALGYLGAAASTAGSQALAAYKLFPANFVGWNEAAALTRELRAAAAAPSVLVADNFLFAAELDFALDGATPVYVLDHPRNVKHGRAPQLALWRRDEAGLRAAAADQAVLLVVERTAVGVRERAAWQAALCTRLADLRLLRELSLFDGRKQFAWYAARVPRPEETPQCAAAG